MNQAAALFVPVEYFVRSSLGLNRGLDLTIVSVAANQAVRTAASAQVAMIVARMP